MPSLAASQASQICFLFILDRAPGTLLALLSFPSKSTEEMWKAFFLDLAFMHVNSALIFYSQDHKEGLDTTTTGWPGWAICTTVGLGLYFLYCASPLSFIFPDSCPSPVYQCTLWLRKCDLILSPSLWLLSTPTSEILPFTSWGSSHSETK